MTEVEKDAAKEQVKATTAQAEGDKGVEGAPAKHPLQHRWTLWFDNPALRGKGGGGWGSSMRPVFTFGTVEEFWR